MTASTSAMSPRACRITRGSQHPDGDEEEDGEGVAHRERVGGGATRKLGPPDRQAGEEGAERHRYAEEACGSDGDAERGDQDGG